MTYKQSKRNRTQSKRTQSKRQKKLRLARKGGAGMMWEITRDDAKRLIISNTTVEEGDPNFEYLIGELMALRLNNPTIEYQTHQQILSDEIAQFEGQFGTEPAYIDGMRQASQDDNEDYTDEYETSDRYHYNELRMGAINRANTYRNDLHNYAGSLLINWQESGSEGSLL